MSEVDWANLSFGERIEATWPGSCSSKHHMDDKQTRLAGHILIYLAQRICRHTTLESYGSIDYLSRDLLERYSRHKQNSASKGAILTHDCISIWERTCDCLMMWDVIEPLDSHVYFFEMLLDAGDIPEEIARRTDLNMWMFACTIDEFFACDRAFDWNRASKHYLNGDDVPGTVVSISRDLVSDFELAGLVARSGERLVWTPKMDPYFYGFYGEGPNLNRGKKGRRKYKPAEAQEFFDRICNDTSP